MAQLTMSNSCRVLAVAELGLAALMLVSVAAQGSERCPSGWALHEDKCYLYISNDKMWYYDAKLHCQSLGNGVTIGLAKTASINALLGSLQNADLSTSWIGAERKDTGWTWDDNTSLTFTSWTDGRPQGSGSGLNCAATLNRNDVQESLTWKDAPCDRVSRNFYCQRPAFAPTTTSRTELDLGVNDDECRQILCGSDCSGDCGWSSTENRCALGHTTRGLEFFAGQCNLAPEATTTDEPDQLMTGTHEIVLDFEDDTTMSPQTDVSLDPCTSILCARDCTGRCGWSTTLGSVCASGHVTLDTEIMLGDCETESPTQPPTVELILTTPPSPNPSSMPQSTAPTQAPTSFPSQSPASTSPSISPFSSNPTAPPSRIPSQSPIALPTTRPSTVQYATTIAAVATAGVTRAANDTSQCGWSTSMTSSISIGSNRRPGNLFKSSVRLDNIVAQTSGQTYEEFIDLCLCHCAENDNCREAAIRVTDKYICTLMSDGGTVVSTNLNVQSFAKISSLSTATPQSVCDWSISLERVTGDAALRPANLFKGDPSIRLLSSSVPNLDACLCRCASMSQCNSAATRVGAGGSLICVLMTRTGGFVSTSMNVTTYARLGSTNTSPNDCNWQSNLAQVSGTDSNLRPANLFLSEHRISQFSDTAASTTLSTFQQRCYCQCSSNNACQMATTRSVDQQRYICTLMSEGGSMVATQLAIETLAKTSNSSRSCEGELIENDWASRGRRPSNLFKTAFRVHQYRELASAISEEVFATGCACSCEARSSCSAASIRSVDGSRVCTLMTEDGGYVNTGISVRTFLRVESP